MANIIGEVKFFPKKVVRLEGIPSKTTKNEVRLVAQKHLTSSSNKSRIDMWTGLLAFGLVATIAYLIAEKGD